MKIVTTAQAFRDLERYVEHVRQHHSTAADDFLAAYDALVTSLARGELDGPEVVLRSGQRVQTWPLPPLRIYYRRLRDHERVYHQARRPIAK